MLNLYFLLIKQIRLLQLFLTGIIYYFFNPFSFFSYAICDEALQEKLSIDKDIVTLNKYYYYTLLGVIGVLSITTIYMLTIYTFPTLDYYDIFQNNVVMDLTQKSERLSKDFSGFTNVVNETNLEWQHYLENDQKTIHLTKSSIQSNQALLKSLAEPKQD